MKLNKKYTDYKLLLKNKNIIKIERDTKLDTYGLNSSGLLVRVGIVAYTENETKQYQIIFSSRGYGTVDSSIIKYNNKMKNKHQQYFEKVNQWLYSNNLEKVRY